MAVLTGKAGAFSLAGATVNGHTLQWALTLTSENVKGRGMGDAAQIRTHLFYDWKVTAQVECTDVADMSISGSTTADTSFVGVECAFVLLTRLDGG